MKRKLWVCLAALVLAMLLLTPAWTPAEEQSCGPAAVWALDGEGTLTIAGTGAVTSRPWASGDVRRVVVEEGITGLAASLFESHALLTEAALPESLTSLGKCAFKGCTRLTAISLPDGIASLGADTFAGCAFLAEVHLPEGLQAIGSSAFNGCTSLTEVVLPAGLAEIKGGAFYGCSRLSRVTFAVTDPAREITISGSAFPAGVSAFCCYPGTAPDRWCQANGITPVYLQAEEPGTVLVLPEGLQVIGSQAFTGLEMADAIRLPGAVAEISDDAFDPGMLLMVPAGSPWAAWAEAHGYRVREE
ncbi:MAG: leucine-rich repeat protein [Clostridia bacterium]|nr:leucine-rich repeat protein [Clostridia bacterium]